MERKKISLPRGTSDILPAESFLWQGIESKSREIFCNYNYKEIRTPIFEDTSLFKRTLGQASDVVNKQLLELVSQRASEGDPLALSGLALRPEGTASVVRSYIENNLDRKELISKFYYIGPMFRGERPQKGRLRQFNQIGAEMIGPGAIQPYQDAEMIALAVNLLKAFGLSNFKLKINSLGNPKDKEKLAKVLYEKLQPYINDLSEYSQQRFERNVFRILDSKEQADKDILKKIELDYSFLSEESRVNYEQVKEALTMIGIDFEEDINLVRGLDYYNYTVFEISDDSLGSQNALGAGGRYNNLVGFLGGEKKLDIGGIGFSLGVERIILGMDKSEECSGSGLDVYFVSLDEDAYKKSFELMNKMREKGISCEMNYSLSSMKSQMRSADKSGALSVIVLGEEELKTCQIVVKSMRADTNINNENITQCLSECGFTIRKD